MKESGPKLESIEDGTEKYPMIDSKLTREQALRKNDKFPIAPEIYERQVLLPVKYFSFDNKYHQGQIVVAKDLAKDVGDFFNDLLEKKFRIRKVIPIADTTYDFNDTKSMEDDNSSSFCPRNIEGTDRLSLHALGRAFDLNPLENPFIKNDVTQPDKAVYEPEKDGTLTSNLVEFLIKRGWRWGGNYESLKDYQHLEKPCGVQEITTDDYGYVVSIVWKDGETTENHFPLTGFTVVDLKTKEHIRKISGEEACDILKENSAKYNRKDFSWAPFARKPAKTKNNFIS